MGSILTNSLVRMEFGLNHLKRDLYKTILFAFFDVTKEIRYIIINKVKI